MPGHQVTVTEPMKPGLICPECGLVLRDAIQTEDGIRLCETCYFVIASTSDLQSEKTGIKLGSKDFYPDRAVRREVLELLVKCSNYKSGCPWEGQLNNYESHQQNCRFKAVKCPNPGCLEILPKELMDSHVDEHCLFRTITCDYCQAETSPMELEKHYETCPEFKVTCTRCNKVTVKRKEVHDDVCEYAPARPCPNDGCEAQLPRHSYEHHVEKACQYRRITCQYCERELPLLQLGFHYNKECPQFERSNSPPTIDSQVTSMPKNFLAAFEPPHLHSPEPVLSVDPFKTPIPEVAEEVDHPVHDFVKEHNDRHKLKNLQSKLGSESRMVQLEKKIEEQERQTAMMKVHISELELQLQASLASTHNGTFLWRIPDVSRRRRDAIEERITSIYSPPFYTGSNGYKMCIRAYLNGDGIGYKTHLSLFFVLMKGEYDPLLKWPFEYKVSLILVDQNHRKHVVQTFKPTPESSSFQRPRSDINVASGCPQFSKLSVLDDSTYVKDDVMYVKSIVDTSRIYHP